MSGILKFIERVCVQTAVYWDNPVSDGRGGITFDSAEEILCRWDDVTELIRSNSGKEEIVHSKIISPSVLKVQGYLYLGSLNDLDSSQYTDPLSVEGAREIIKVEKTPLFRKTDEFVYVYYLK